LRQPLGIVATAAHHVKGETLRRFLSDARQMFEFADKAREGFGKIRHLELTTQSTADAPRRKDIPTVFSASLRLCDEIHVPDL